MLTDIAMRYASPYIYDEEMTWLNKQPDITKATLVTYNGEIRGKHIIRLFKNDVYVRSRGNICIQGVVITTPENLDVYYPQGISIKNKKRTNTLSYNSANGNTPTSITSVAGLSLTGI